MGRRLLAGVEIVDNWTSLAGALAGALRFLREPATAPWVMGVSGLAFRLALPVTDGEVAAGSMDTALEPARTAALVRNLGRKVEIIAAWAGERDVGRRRAEAIRRVHKSIDRGVPAVVYDLQLPRFGLVKGYDDRAMVWYVSTAISSQYGETLPVARWPVPERSNAVFALLLGGRVKVDPRRAVLEALRYALDYAARGEPGDPSGARHGFEAYARWQAAFARGEPLSAAGNALLVQALQSARRDAAAFLRADAARLLPGPAQALLRAADAYQAEVLALSRMVTMFPFPSGGDPDNPAARLTAVAALREALAREQDALEAIGEAVGSGQ